MSYRTNNGLGSRRGLSLLKVYAALATRERLEKKKLRSPNTKAEYSMKTFITKLPKRPKEVALFRELDIETQRALVAASGHKVFDPLKLITAQPGVLATGVMYFASDVRRINKPHHRDDARFPMETAVVVETKMGSCLVDGNTRANAAWLRRVPIKARYIKRGDLIRAARAEKAGRQAEISGTVDQCREQEGLSASGSSQGRKKVAHKDDVSVRLHKANRRSRR